MNKKWMQSVLITWTMNSRDHFIALPNDTTFSRWECDLLSISRSEFSHEHEIKISRADYLREFKKERKQEWLTTMKAEGPNYYWFVTFNFDIEPPLYAGWIKIIPNPDGYHADIRIMKKAPLRHKTRISLEWKAKLANLLSYRLSHAYWELYRKKVQNVER